MNFGDADIDISEELSGQIQKMEELDYFENLARLIENMEFLSDQNPVLVETLLGIFRFIEHTEEAIYGVTGDDLRTEIARLKEEARDFIDYAAESAAEYHADEVKKRGDQMYERLDRRLDVLSDWRYRIDEERHARRGGKDD